MKLHALLSTAALALSASLGTPPLAAQPAAGAPLEAGKDYQALSPAQPASTDAGKVEVAEVFMFGCPGCFAFEPHLEQWRKSQPEYVHFVRIPAIWNAVAEIHARAYYTAVALGKADEIAAPFFDEYHVKGNTLETEDKLAEFFGRFGVDADTFKKTFYSLPVETNMKRAMELVERYHVPSTPSVIVNGKYLTNGTMARTYDRWFEIIEELAARERANP